MDRQRVDRGVTGSAPPTRGGFFAGIGFLLRGLQVYRRNPALMVLGLIPALIAFVGLVAAFVALALFVDDLVAFITPYMADWNEHLRRASRVVIEIAVIVVWLVLSVLGYVTVTLLIGQPFYEAISKRVEDQLGGVPGEINVSFWRTLPRSIADSVRVLVVTALFSILIFATGLIPVAGEVAAPVLGAMLGGWVLALELSSVPFERRGLRLRERRRVLRARRSMALGFGVATFVCFLIPLGAVLVMPAAVAGATLLSRRALGQPDTQPATWPVTQPGHGGSAA